MAVSQNGWAAFSGYGDANLTKLSWVTGSVRKGDVYTVFNEFCKRFNSEVEKINKAHSWGFAPRNIVGSTATSNHASGTAIDLNAPAHPLGKANTFSPAQRAAIGKLLSEFDGVIRWGGNYAGRKDDMHFEINASSARVSALAKKLTGKSSPAPSKPAPSKPAPAPSGGGKTNSIVDYLNSKGKPSSFTARAALARQYGISPYTGTAAQNLQLLDKVRGGASTPPKTTSKPTPAPSAGKGDTRTVSIVTYLNSINQPSSFSARAALAKQHGISPYSGTASQNTALLSKLRGGGGGSSAPSGKSVSQMASEVIRGTHGNGHANRQKSLGVTNAVYAQVRAEVNRRS